MAMAPKGIDDDFESDSEDDVLPLENGKPEPAKTVAPKPVSAATPKVKAEEPVKEVEADSDDDSSDEDDSSDDDDDLLGDSDDDSDAEDGSSDEEDEKTPTPIKENKKRPTEPESKTPVPSKKAKFTTPQKTDGKKVAASVVHVATPHPAKQAAKTPASSGKVSCGTCSKTFNSDKALDSHSKAKHAVK